MLNSNKNDNNIDDNIDNNYIGKSLCSMKKITNQKKKKKKTNVLDNTGFGDNVDVKNKNINSNDLDWTESADDVKNSKNVITDSTKTNKPITNVDLVKGHRQRLKNRFNISKESFEDYELLEMLLFYVFSRIDTRSLAKTLLLKFDNSLKDVIHADEDQLRDVKGIGDGVIALLGLLKEINCRILKDETALVKNKNGRKNSACGVRHINNIDDILNSKPVLNNISAIKKYFKHKIGNLVKEEILVLFLNNRCNLVAEEVINVGNASESKINNSIILSKALNNASSRVVLAHNHPSGDYTPSVSDLKITQNLKNLLENFGISLLEHVVVSKHGAIGMIESGMVD